MSPNKMDYREDSKDESRDDQPPPNLSHRFVTDAGCRLCTKFTTALELIDMVAKVELVEAQIKEYRGTQQQAYDFDVVGHLTPKR